MWWPRACSLYLQQDIQKTQADICKLETHSGILWGEIKGKIWAKPNCMLIQGCPTGVHFATLLGAHQCPAKGCTWFGISLGLKWQQWSRGRYLPGREVLRQKENPPAAEISCFKLYLCKGLTWSLVQFQYPACSEGSKSRPSQCCDENITGENSSTAKSTLETLALILQHIPELPVGEMICLTQFSSQASLYNFQYMAPFPGRRWGHWFSI